VIPPADPWKVAEPELKRPGSLSPAWSTARNTLGASGTTVQGVA